MEILYVFVQLFEVQDHSPSVIFLRSHKDWKYVFLVWVMCISYHYGCVPVFPVLAVQWNLCLPLLPSWGFLHLLWSISTGPNKNEFDLLWNPLTAFVILVLYLVHCHRNLLPPLVHHFDFLLLVIFPPELSYPSLVPRFCSPPEAAVAPPRTLLQGVCPKKGPFCPCL